jgi:hypothetical protein
MGNSLTGLAWLVVIAARLSQIFVSPPYSFSIVQVGLCNISSFIATVIGCVIAEPLSDRLAVWMAKRNGGIYGEPSHTTQ